MKSTRRQTLLAVHAHPDDETITMGGTLARYSAEGVRTVVVTCTRGDLGEVRDPCLLGDGAPGALVLTGAAVAALRDGELDAPPLVPMPDPKSSRSVHQTTC
jgi:N-acetyl-1-D-myo-inositol-2-amino-2-deoxy-alpha-D-glucopyranoside deacetylase